MGFWLPLHITCSSSSERLKKLTPSIRDPPWRRGHGNQLLYRHPPGWGGVTLIFCFGMSDDKILRFSVRDISCKQYVQVQVKLIHFLVGFGLGLDFSDIL